MDAWIGVAVDVAHRDGPEAGGFAPRIVDHVFDPVLDGGHGQLVLHRRDPHQQQVGAVAQRIERVGERAPFARDLQNETGMDVENRVHAGTAGPRGIVHFGLVLPRKVRNPRRQSGKGKQLAVDIVLRIVVRRKVERAAGRDPGSVGGLQPRKVGGAVAVMVEDRIRPLGRLH